MNPRRFLAALLLAITATLATGGTVRAQVAPPATAPAVPAIILPWHSRRSPATWVVCSGVRLVAKARSVASM